MSTTLSENLKYLLKVNEEMSISELARQTQIPQPTLHHLLNGTTKKPRRNVLEKLANFFSVSIVQLMGVVPLELTVPESVKQRLNISILPILPWDLLSTWMTQEKIPHQLPQVIFDKPIHKKSFALTVENSRMEPIFPEGSLLIFDPSKEPRDRDFVIVHLLENDKILFNRFFSEGGERFIKQDQPDGNIKLIKLKSRDKLLGTLLEVRLHFQ